MKKSADQRMVQLVHHPSRVPFPRSAPQARHTQSCSMALAAACSRAYVQERVGARRRALPTVVGARLPSPPGTALFAAPRAGRPSSRRHAAAEQLVTENERTTAGAEPSGDPWRDAPWSGMQWTVYRGKAYDLTGYLASGRHPGGQWLLRLAIKREATALFESYHLRPEVAAAHLRRLPEIQGFPINAVPPSPRPNDSELYNAIRERVRREVFKGEDASGVHRSGTEGAALAVLGYAALAWAAYYASPNVLTGAALGLAGAWIGLTVQHCGNHGAMSTNATLNAFYGLCADLTGGSALMWRYHHQVSHHIHCNDEAFDEDVFSALPFLRFDPRLERKWFHRYQHLYMWLMYPFLQVVFQIGDWKGLLTGRTPGATLYGASQGERWSVVFGKLAHYALLWVLPVVAHGFGAVLPAALAYTAMQGIVLSTTFAVSHNLEENKPSQGRAGSVLDQEYMERDWCLQQIQTSSNWGGVVGNFFTGGLNLQIEHHLFPAIAFVHYPAIARIVRDECKKRGVEYAHYDTLPEILGRYVRYMRDVGTQDVPEGWRRMEDGAWGTRQTALSKL